MTRINHFSFNVKWRKEVIINYYEFSIERVNLLLQNDRAEITAVIVLATDRSCSQIIAADPSLLANSVDCFVIEVKDDADLCPHFVAFEFLM